MLLLCLVGFLLFCGFFCLIKILLGLKKKKRRNVAFFERKSVYQCGNIEYSLYLQMFYKYTVFSLLAWKLRSWQNDFWVVNSSSNICQSLNRFAAVAVKEYCFSSCKRQLPWGFVGKEGMWACFLVFVWGLVLNWIFLYFQLSSPFVFLIFQTLKDKVHFSACFSDTVLAFFFLMAK